MSRAKVTVRIALSGLALIVVLLIAAALLLPRFVDGAALCARISGRLYQQPGATAQCETVTLALFPTPHVVLDQVRLSVPETVDAELPSATVRPRLLALLRGKLQISEIRLETPTVILHRLPPATQGGAPRESESGSMLESAVASVLGPVAAIGASPLAHAVLVVTNARVEFAGGTESGLITEQLDARIGFSPDGLSLDLQTASNAWRRLTVRASLDPTAGEGSARIEFLGLRPHLLTSQLAAAGLRLHDAEVNLDVHLTLHDADTLSASIDASIPGLTLSRGSGDVTLRGVRLAGSVKIEAQATEATLDELQLDDPPLQLSGRLSLAPDAAELDVQAENLDVDSVRNLVNQVAGEVDLVHDIFDILRSGTLPEITFRSRAPSLDELGREDAFTIRGRLLDGRVHVPGADLDLDRVSGNATVTAGVLAGEQVSAQLGHTTATAGRFRIGLNDPEPELYVEVSVQADATESLALLRRVVHDESFQRELERVNDVSGTLTGRLLLDGTTKQLAVTVETSTFDLTGRVEGIDVPMHLKGGHFRYDSEGIQAHRINVAVGDSTLADVAVRIRKDEQSSAVEATAGQSRLVLGDIYPWIAAYRPTSQSRWDPQWLSGTLSLSSLRVSGPLERPNDWRFELRGSAEGFAAGLPQLPIRLTRDYPVSLSDFVLEYDARTGTSFTGDVAARGRLRGAVDLEWDSNRLHVKHLRVRDLQSDASMTLSLTPRDADVSFTGSLHKTTLDALMENEWLGGLLEGDARVRVRRDDPLSSTMEGTLSASAVNLPLPDGSHLTLQRLSLEDEDGAIALEAALDVGSSHFDLSGRMERTPEAFTADLDLTSEHIDWADIEPLLDRNSTAEQMPAAAPTERPLRGTMRIAAESFTFDALTWQGLRGHIDFGEQGPALTVTDGEVCGVTTPGKIALDEDGMKLAFDVAASGQPLEALVPCVGVKDETATGRFDVTGSVTAGGAPRDLTRSLEGQLEIHAVDGRFYGMGLAARLFSVVSIATGSVRNVASLAEQGLPFDHVSIRADVKGSTLSVAEASFDGPSMKWAAEGSVDLVARTLDLTFLVAAMKNADAFVARIPLIGSIMGGSLVTVPVKIVGPFDNPSMAPLAPSAVGRGLMRVMKRTLDLRNVVLEPLRSVEEEQ